MIVIYGYHNGSNYRIEAHGDIDEVFKFYEPQGYLHCADGLIFHFEFYKWIPSQSWQSPILCTRFTEIYNTKNIKYKRIYDKDSDCETLEFADNTISWIQVSQDLFNIHKNKTETTNDEYF